MPEVYLSRGRNLQWMYCAFKAQRFLPGFLPLLNGKEQYRPV